MSNDWDVGYNVSSLTPEQLQQTRIQESQEQARVWVEQRAERDRRAGYITIPEIPDAVIRENFGRWRDHVIQQDGMRYPLAPWAANRMIWMCHNCGAFGYKYTLRETFKCYCCHRRDVTVCRSGEISMFIRGQGPRPGVNMQDLFQQRQERLRLARRRT